MDILNSRAIIKDIEDEKLAQDLPEYNIIRINKLETILTLNLKYVKI